MIKTRMPGYAPLVPVHRYLFNEYNVPRADKDKLNMMNRELIERLTIVANNIYRNNSMVSDFKKLEMYEEVSQMVVEEVFCKYS
jgi:hypothetical protein